ncbi:MAG: hypothetical protein HY671_00745 [Chloroflexi bacterium]|nr:hypothetical protein [Chloroflexota bacterium]
MQSANRKKFFGWTGWRLRLTLAAFLAVISAGVALGTAEATNGTILPPPPPPEGSSVQKAEFTFTPAEVLPGAFGDGKFELRMRTDGGRELRARSNAEGLVPGLPSSLCANDVPLVTADTLDKGRVTLEKDLGDGMVTATTLEGVFVAVHVGSGCGGTPALSHTISAADIR